MSKLETYMPGQQGQGQTTLRPSQDQAIS